MMLAVISGTCIDGDPMAADPGVDGLVFVGPVAVDDNGSGLELDPDEGTGLERDVDPVVMPSWSTTPCSWQRD